MQLDSGLLEKAYLAPSYFAQMLGRACHISNPHQTLAPLIERFIAEVLFERPVNIYSGEGDHRMRNADVQEHIRATFTPLIRGKVHRKQERQLMPQWVLLCTGSLTRRPARPIALPYQQSVRFSTSCPATTTASAPSWTSATTHLMWQRLRRTQDRRN
jgi:hypothetical protein